MALISLGRNAMVAERADELPPVGGKTVNEVHNEANKKLEDARRGILDALTPWIPGDFVVTYGLLLTAWTEMRASFPWMLLVASLSAILFIVGGAFAETGFRRASDKSKKVRNRLLARTLLGFVVSVYASVAIPTSGWYDFKGFADNELAWVVTASVLVSFLVLLLKGFQKRWGLTSA
jgi:hypothetical protein